MSTAYVLRLPRAVYAAVVDHALATLPNECCGLLAGQISGGFGFATRYFPLTNDALEPTREYHSEPKSIFQAHRAMREENLTLLAICHSHPTAPPRPSRKDCAENIYGDSLIHLISSLQDGQPEVRAWWMRDGEFWEGKWEFVDDAEFDENREDSRD